MTDYQKHSVSTDALDTLGSIISPEEGRDAIHLAVYPIEAAHQLSPAEHVKIKDGKAIHATAGEGVGIVDPFLLDFIQPGEWFWLVVYPRQITSLRHVWEHDSFPASGEVNVNAQKAEAEAWIRAWLPTVDLPYTFEQVMEAISTGRSTSPNQNGYDWGSLVYRNGEFYSSGVDAYGSIPDKFWDMAEQYLGVKITQRTDYFSCSC